MTKRVCCLYRVSTIKQVDFNQQNQADIPLQRRACREFAESMGWEIVCEEQEAGVSGYKTSAANRTAIQRIKERALNGEFDILLVFMFDRLGRKDDETPFIVEWLVNHGVEVWSVKEGQQKFDNHVDFLMNYIRFWQASGESKKTSIRTKNALEQLVVAGRFRGGVAPYGYRLAPSGICNKRKHEVFMLVVDEAEASVVRLMFELCIDQGYGRWRIAATLNERGLKNRAGTNWHEATVGHILRNILYAGVLRNGNARSGVMEQLQIISMERFETAQMLMDERKNEYNAQRTMPRNTRGKSLLSGNVFCEHCGGRLILTSSSTTYIAANGEKTIRKRYRYICYNKTRKRAPCNGPTGYTMHILDEKISALLMFIFREVKRLDVTCLSEIREREIRKLQSQVTELENRLTRAEKEYAAVKSRLSEAIVDNQGTRIDCLMDISDKAYEKVIVTRQELQSLCSRQEHQMQAREKLQGDYERIIEWADIFPICSASSRKMIASYIIEKVFVGREYSVQVTLRTNTLLDMISAERMPKHLKAIQLKQNIDSM